MRIVIAPDSLKGSLSAEDAAAAIAEGWADARPGDDVLTLPQADGGEGTCAAIAAAVPGATWHETGPVTGPDGRPRPGAWLELPGGTGVVEMALVSALPMMARLDPLGATSRGLGEVLRHACQAGLERIVIGVGGSASTDGGLGALRALGLTVEPSIADGGGAMLGLRGLDATSLMDPPPGGVEILVDVNAPLLGPRGSAAVFGPQKGASAADIEILEQGLAKFASLAGGSPDEPGSGAAGGVAYGLATLWGATLTSGAARVAELSGLAEAVQTADVLVTGEGRFDATSLTGKVVGHAIDLAEAAGARPMVIAGRVPGIAPANLWTCQLVDYVATREEAIADAAALLRRAGRAAAEAAN